MTGLAFGVESWVRSWVRTPGAAAIGRTLLHSLWEGAAVALALAFVLCIVRSSRIRYAAACLAMLAMLSGLVATFARLAPEAPVHIRLAKTGSVSTIQSGHVALPPVSARESRPLDDLAWLAPFWIAGVLIFHLRGVASWMAARRLRHTGVCCAPALWQARLDRLGVRLRLARPIALLESCLAEVPVVIGYLRPVILMPVGLLAGLPAGQVEAILLHELAHIRRYDYLVNLLQVFVEGLLFYHPAVWWISGVIRAERENCCDDLVVGVTGGALEYATALTALEQRRENAGMALAATGGSLVNRIQRLLGSSERRYAMAMPVVTAALLTVSVVAALAALQVGPAGRAGDRVKPVESLPVQATTSNQSALPTSSSDKPTLLAQASPLPHTDRPTEPSPAQVGQPGQADRQLDVEGERREFVEQFWLRRDPTSATPRVTTLLPQLAATSPATYKKWVDEDVAYIISDEERAAFRRLATDEEREKFVEQFWLRRDPTPGTAENEFKQEHYRRIAYANEHFTASVPGWRTDRGRIYIQYGPPDEIEAHAGGFYPRPAAQGGGVTGTFPFVQWRYRYIEGIGNIVILEFVDRSGEGEYMMTVGPRDKDNLLQPPGAPVR